jgi:hypothetical protein
LHFRFAPQQTPAARISEVSKLPMQFMRGLNC